MELTLLNFLILFLCLSAEATKITLKLSCDSFLCQSKGIVKEFIDNDTLILFENCENFDATKVTELQISWARKGISKSFVEFEKLEVLKVTHSVLENFKPKFVSSFKALEKVILDGNEIKHLNEFQEMKSLRKLFLARNSIEIIKKGTFSNLYFILILNLEDNKIFHINSKAFKENKNLQNLNLNRNELSFLEPQVFHENFELIEICLSYNKLKQLHKGIFLNNTKLEVLRLHSNQIQSLDKNIFVNNKVLKWIELGENQLTFLDSKVFQLVTNLDFVDLADNECITGSFPVTMKHEHLLKQINRNCHYLAAYYSEII